MNIIKASIATAAVLTCCMPANAGLSAREEKVFENAYQYGYAYGALAESCTMFLAGHVSEDEVTQSANWVKNNEDLLPMFKTRIAENFQNMANDDSITKVCNPIVQRVLNPVRQRRMGSVQRADYLY